mmetsp:Transcript_49615/g.106256  ORF Transcript_49615/g.106256 Transcript_49615/m.106256 type:complete len:276 (-) Transcript_49615:580-1407(-)
MAQAILLVAGDEIQNQRLCLQLCGLDTELELVGKVVVEHPAVLGVELLLVARAPPHDPTHGAYDIATGEDGDIIVLLLGGYCIDPGKALQALHHFLRGRGNHSWLHLACAHLDPRPVPSATGSANLHNELLPRFLCAAGLRHHLLLGKVQLPRLGLRIPHPLPLLLPLATKLLRCHLPQALPAIDEQRVFRIGHGEHLFRLELPLPREHVGLRRHTPLIANPCTVGGLLAPLAPARNGDLDDLPIGTAVPLRCLHPQPCGLGLFALLLLIPVRLL